MQTENEAYVELLCRHLADMIHRLRAIAAGQWDWTPAPSAPSPRIIAQHTWNWLVADRQHLQEPNVTRHLPIPDSPTDPEALCEALEAERDYWRETLPVLTPEQLAEERFQFGMAPFGVRTLVTHITHLFLSVAGHTPLKLAVMCNRPEIVALLLQARADSDEIDPDQNTPLVCASFYGYTQVVEVLLQHGVDVHLANRWNGTPLGFAHMQNHQEIATLLEQAGATH